MLSHLLQLSLPTPHSAGSPPSSCPPPPPQAMSYSSQGENGLVYGPAAAANFRANLLRTGGIADEDLARIRLPTLLLCGARDRLLPAIEEGE